MMSGKNFLIIYLILLAAIICPMRVLAGETRAAWQDEWEKTIRAAEQEGQLNLYSLSEIGEAIANSGFVKKFPKIKMSVINARGGEHVSRIMAERRAGKFLADVGN